MDCIASIIIPAYKCQQTIEKCVMSALNQDINDIEVIVVLDGEFDDSGDIVRNIALEDERLKVISKLNEGVSVARNVGLVNAKGAWIAFVDSDDWIEPDYISSLIKNGEESDIILCDYFAEYNTTSSEKHFFNINYDQLNNIDKLDLIESCMVNTDILNKETITNIGVPWAKLYNRSFLINNSLEFVPGLKRMQDSVFNMYSFWYADKIKYIKTPLYHYTKNECASTTSYRDDFSKTSSMIIEHYNNFFQKNKINDKKAKDAFEAKVILLTLEMILLQFVPIESPGTIRQKIGKIKKIINVKYYQNSFKNFNNQFLTTKQKILALFLHFNIIFPIYLLNLWRYKNMRKRLIKL